MASAALLLVALVAATALAAQTRSEEIGIGAHSYKRPNATGPAESIPVYLSGLTSATTQLAYSYYHLDFCQPTKGSSAATNLGDALLGTEMKPSDYKVQVLHNSGCQVLCRMDPTHDTLVKMKSFIESSYMVNWCATVD